MAKQIYLINSTTFKDYEDISINVKPERLLVFVKKMQDLDLKLFLSHPLYYDFIQYCSNTAISDIKISTPATTAGDGAYEDEAVITSGAGIEATADIVVIGGIVKSIVINQPGIDFKVGDSFTIAAIPGASFTVLSNGLAFADNTPAAYVDLFNGTTYVDRYGHTIEYEGMIPMLVYNTFARFIEADSVRFTASGPVIKDVDNSRGLTVSESVKLVQQQRSVANAHANEVTKYLYDNRKDFPLWGYINQNTNSSRQAGPRIRGIDKTKFNYPNGGLGYGNMEGDYFDINGLI